MKEVKVTIDIKSFLSILGVLLLGIVFWQIRSVVVMFFISFILYAGLKPFVLKLEKRNISRPVSIGLILLSLVLILGFIGILFTNELVNQLVNLINAFPGIFESITSFIQQNIPALAEILPLSALQNEVGVFVNEALNSGFFSSILTGENFISAFSQTVGIFGSVFGMLVSVVTVVMVTIYMLVRQEEFYEPFLKLTSVNNAKRFRKTINKVQKSLGNWLIGQFSLMTIIAIVTYVVIWVPSIFDPTYVLHLYALPIAIIAGIFEAIPNVGPLVTTIFAGTLALGTSGVFTLIYVIVAFLLIQNIEAAFLVPSVMKKAIGIDPIVSILGIIGAFELAGVLGAILIIPMIGITQIIIQEVIAFSKADQVKA